MNLKSALRTSPAAALLGVALFSSPQLIGAAPQQELSVHIDAEEAANAELKELGSLSAQLDNDADQLNSLILSGLHWQTHSSHLNQIKADVNQMGDRLEALQAMRSFAAPWQQEAIDSIIPMALEVADRTTAAITHLNENHQFLWAPEYVDHLRTIAARSDEMHERLNIHLQIMEDRNKIEMLQDKLAVRGS